MKVQITISQDEHNALRSILDCFKMHRQPCNYDDEINHAEAFLKRSFVAHRTNDLGHNPFAPSAPNTGGNPQGGHHGS